MQLSNYEIANAPTIFNKKAALQTTSSLGSREAIQLINALFLPKIITSSLTPEQLKGSIELKLVRVVGRESR